MFINITTNNGSSYFSTNVNEQYRYTYMSLQYVNMQYMPVFGFVVNKSNISLRKKTPFTDENIQVHVHTCTNK